jgi:hypothetical protein
VDASSLNPAALASQVLPMIVIYLRHIGGRIADHITDDLDDAVMNRLTAVYDSVKAKLTGGSFAGQALEHLEQEPENERRQGAFEAAMTEVIEGDPRFASMLARTLEETRRIVGPTLTRIEQSGATSIHGDVILEGTNVAGRDVHIGDQQLH